jgi:RNA polymerase sigma factor (sigma-70 family)
MTSAQTTLVDTHLSMVRQVARGFARKYPLIDLDDFVSNGSLRLMRLAEKYDSSHKTTFGQFAYKPLWGCMMEVVRKEASRTKTISLDGPSSRGSTVRLSDTLPGEIAPPYPTVDDDAAWDELIGCLPPRSRRIVAMYAREGLSTLEVSKIEGVGPDMIRRIIAEASETLKATTLSHVRCFPTTGRRRVRSKNKKAVVNCAGERFESLSAAGRAMGVSDTSVSLAIKRGGTSAGFKWKFAEAA